jgi:hypothetical protein
MRALLIYGIGLLAVLALAIISRPVPLPPTVALTGPMTLPADYRTSFIQYAVVDRPDGVTRTLYISPESYAALQSGAPLPNETRIVIEAFEGTPGENGRLVAGEMVPFIHMAEKRESWQLDELHTSAKVGDWNFASFESETGVPSDPNILSENLNDCFTCHDSSASATRDFIFTRRTIDVFASTKTSQYIVCNQPERIPCRF